MKTNDHIGVEIRSLIRCSTKQRAPSTKHQAEKHNSQSAKFEMKVLGSFKDPMSRQITEAVMIKNHQGTLLNSKAEFHQPSIVRVRQEIVRGLEE